MEDDKGKRTGIAGVASELDTMRYALLIMVAFSMIFLGCGVTLCDHTPPEFPWKIQREFGLLFEEALYSFSTPPQVLDLGKNPEHRFILEVKPTHGISNIRAYVTVNNVVYPMVEYPSAGSGAGLWIFEYPDKCQSGYDYHYRVNYKQWPNTSKSKFLGTSESPLYTGVTGYGDVIWGVPGGVVYTDTLAGDVIFSFYKYEDEELTLFIQNLINNPVILNCIMLDDEYSPELNNDEFEVLDVPAGASCSQVSEEDVVLNCGESLRFRVRWNGQTHGARGALFMHASPVGGLGTVLQEIVTLIGIHYVP